jgi:TonB family protein
VLLDELLKNHVMKTKKIFSLRMALQMTITLIVLIIIPLIPSCASKKKAVQAKSESAAPLPPPPPPVPVQSEPYVVVEEMPLFPGGDSALLMHIAKNIVYPEGAKKAGIQGRVIARFAVTKTGIVDRVSVIKGVSPELDSEAIRVISALPAFKPGRQGGVAVDVWYMVPITFTVKGKEPKPAVSNNTTSYTGNEPFVVVEEMPMFPGGDSALLSHITRSVRYPESAIAAGIQGRVISRFCVNVDGSVGRISILKGVHPELDAEAIRVVSNLPLFRPGKQGGVAVPVWYMVPIEFKLK